MSDEIRDESAAQPKAGPSRPVVIVDHASITYHVYAGGRRLNPGQARVRGQKLHEVQAVRDVSFEVKGGESLGLIGTNGSGKSSILRGIAGLTPLSSGAVYASAQPTLLGVGAALISTLSGRKNILLGCLAMGFSREEAEELTEPIIEFCGLGEFIDYPMRTYSSGMSARLKFAIAASRDQDILIVDEALSVGDRQFKAKSEARIRQLRENAGTVFLVSHQMSSIRESCNRVIWLNKGTLMADGEPDDVIKQYEEFVAK